MNYNTGEIAWRNPFGRVDELEAKGVMNTGSLNKGGRWRQPADCCLSAPAYDSRFHAFESKTGKLLWKVKLGASAQAKPSHV